MKYRIFIAILSLLLLASCTSASGSEEGTIPVSGTVTQQTEEGSLEPVSDVVVQAGGRLDVTGADGKYEVTLHPGEFELRASKGGFKQFSQMIQITEDEESLVLDITLMQE